MKQFLSTLVILTFGILSPVITFGISYVFGIILNYFVGAGLVRGLNLLFDTSRFTRDTIPLIYATLATIGSCFKANSINASKSD